MKEKVVPQPEHVSGAAGAFDAAGGGAVGLGLVLRRFTKLATVDRLDLVATEGTSSSTTTQSDTEEC